MYRCFYNNSNGDIECKYECNFLQCEGGVGLWVIFRTIIRITTFERNGCFSNLNWLMAS